MTRLSDRALWLAIAAVLFALSAWPLVLVELPPLQDLPNHLASAYIAEHLDRYPDYAFNGFVRSNALLELWLHAFRDQLIGAGRAFTAIALAANALALPWCAWQLGGRRALVNAGLFGWPLVHGFCLAMGMLNFAIAVPLALVVLVLLDRQRAAVTISGSLAIVALSFVAWIAHPFPLVVVGALCAIEVVAQPGWEARVRAARALLVPLAPIGGLVAGTALHHLIKPAGAAPSQHGIAFLTPWELVAHFWLDASGALTRWGSTTAIPALLLPIAAWRGRRDGAARSSLVGGRAIAALAIAYAGMPLMLSNWWYLNTRVVPFLWFALVLQVPRMPRAVVALLVAAALAFSAALGADYIRLDRDRAAFIAGIPAVPPRAALLPLLFRHGRTSDFTASLTHAWGYYVLARETAAPLVFAVERSYPLTYKRFPPAALIPPALDRFAELNATPAHLCAVTQLRDLADCTARWRLVWSQFWRLAEPRFDHLLTWAMPDEARAIIPAGYRPIFTAGDLAIYARRVAAASR